MAAPHVAGLLLSGWDKRNTDGVVCLDSGSDPDGDKDGIAARR